MAYTFNGSSDYIELVSDLGLSTDPKVTMFVWGKPDDTTSDHTALGWSRDDGTTGNMRIEFAGAQTGDPIRARRGNNVTAASSNTGAYSANKWTAAVGRFISATSRYGMKDVLTATQSTTSVTASTTLHVVTVGCFWTSGSTRTGFFGGKIAEVGIVSGDVTSNEGLLFAMGVPLDEIFPSNRLLSYLPLHKDTRIADLSQYRRVFTASGAVAVDDHPPIIYTRKRRVYLVSAPGASAAVTGTATASITEADVVAGGKTIIITLTGDTWLTSAGGLFDAIRQDIIDGLDSAQAEALGWNNEVRDNLAVTTVVRTSDTVVTITLSAQAAYDITAQETITVTVPLTALTLGLAPITASPTFTVSHTATTSIPVFRHHYLMQGSA